MYKGRVQGMRYGENPYQLAAFYRDPGAVDGVFVNYKQLQGKELSYNNIADADVARECVKSFDAAHGAAHVIIKRANPCGVAIGGTAQGAYEKAFKTNSTSAFGGIIAFNIPLDEAATQVAAEQLVEMLAIPGSSEGARAMFVAKQNVCVLEIPLDKDVNAYDFKRVGGGLLVQSPDARNVQPSGLRVVTKRHLTPKGMDDLMFAWRVTKFIESSVIMFCGGGVTLGVGTGQMSHVGLARIASTRARSASLALADSAVTSNAFFPFRDGLDVMVDADASRVIQPGGSVRDDEVIATADKRNVAMIFTGTRHFRY